jgi:hypothetical protein
MTLKISMSPTGAQEGFARRSLKAWRFASLSAVLRAPLEGRARGPFVRKDRPGVRFALIAGTARQEAMIVAQSLSPPFIAATGTAPRSLHA